MSPPLLSPILSLPPRVLSSRNIVMIGFFRGFSAAGLISLLVIAGCVGTSNEPMFSGKTIPVKGTVTYKGKPLKRGVVRFEPDAGREAEGTIGPDGTFTLTTFQPGDGAIPGAHRVAVFTPKKKEIPPRYSNFALSGIEVEVQQDRTEYAINLK
jgi:hypothetical protein